MAPGPSNAAAPEDRTPECPLPLHRGYDMSAQPSITHCRLGTADKRTTPTMTLTYVRKDLPTTQQDTALSDATPDLPWIHGPLRAIWEKKEGSLGSDHHILELRIQISSRLRRTTATYPQTNVTDWPKARTNLDTVEATACPQKPRAPRYSPQFNDTERRLSAQRISLMSTATSSPYGTNVAPWSSAGAPTSTTPPSKPEYKLSTTNAKNMLTTLPYSTGLTFETISTANFTPPEPGTFTAPSLGRPNLRTPYKNCYWPKTWNLHYISALPEDLDTGINPEFSIDKLWLAMLQLKLT
ncbi:hypothetical protein HPB47_008160 [Ixodes persulcatus]|uniref:Uncharacterized protein n=1 Tax=Ixodes persulcatus TaxID=34615 RepID=A0AC60P6B0_IXOPE|nr:hypothetical protein HPB47_008160 [Ixodes persulcatus]